MDTREQIEYNLLTTYKKTGKIGRTKPFNMEHAKKIAYAASLNIFKKQLNTTTLSAPKGRSPLSPIGCCQLKLFSTIN